MNKAVLDLRFMEKCTVSIDLRSVSVILQVISLKLAVRAQRYFAVSMFNAEVSV